MYNIVFNTTLYIGLTICLIGSFWQISKWFRLNIGLDTADISVKERLTASILAIGKNLFSRKILIILKILVLDIILQIRVLKVSFIRWFAHISIFTGFMLLLFMHALEDIISVNLFSDYASTLNPFMFLRNLFGAMVVLGVIIAICRRIMSKKFRITNASKDWIAISLVSIIIFSGFLLEGAKIISSNIFDQMVIDYCDSEDEEEINSLKAYWAREFDVVFSENIKITGKEFLEKGAEMHEENCMSCHTKPAAAFISYPIALSMKPVGNFLNKLNVEIWLLYIHFISCFFALAYLPFSKFFHLISTPVSMIVKAVEDTESTTSPANRATKRIMGLDACTHCGACTTHCSVFPVFHINPNTNILPSEKLASIKSLAKGEFLNLNQLEAISEGSFICTGCNKCTTICPSGINLQDLWQASKEELIKQGFPEPHLWVDQHTASEWADKIKEYKVKPSSKIVSFKDAWLSDNPETFESCVQCSICTNVCPVVAVYDDPSKDLDFTPQQIMNLLRLELKDVALGSRMLWNCSTCYMCQEHCPQGVKVADILYELRNIAYEKFKPLKYKDPVGDSIIESSDNKTDKNDNNTDKKTKEN